MELVDWETSPYIKSRLTRAYKLAMGKRIQQKPTDPKNQFTLE
jgi:hypothetical protein